jgi:hypothetical protein
MYFLGDGRDQPFSWNYQAWGTHCVRIKYQGYHFICVEVRIIDTGKTQKKNLELKQEPRKSGPKESPSLRCLESLMEEMCTYIMSELRARKWPTTSGWFYWI